MTDKIEVKPPSLVRKLASVMGACERVPKTGFNKFHNYAYATESDITAGVRAEMAIQGVMMIPTVEKIEWQEVTTAKGGKERLCTVSWLFTLLDSDSPEKIEFRNIGQGQDSGDKAFYKAATGAVKYALLKLFLIPTGDDPEAASPEADHGPSAAEIAERAAAVEKVKADREAARKKLMSGLAAVGITEEAVADILGHSPSAISNDEWAKLQKLGADAKAAMADPDEAARIEVSRQAEAALEAEKKRGTVPQTQAQTEQALKNSIFQAAVDRIRGALTEADVLMIGATFATLGLPETDLKSLRRAYTDKMLLLQDNIKEGKKKKLAVKDEVP